MAGASKLPCKAMQRDRVKALLQQVRWHYIAFKHCALSLLCDWLYQHQSCQCIRTCCGRAEPCKMRLATGQVLLPEPPALLQFPALECGTTWLLSAATAMLVATAPATVPLLCWNLVASCIDVFGAPPFLCMI